MAVSGRPSILAASLLVFVGWAGCTGAMAPDDGLLLDQREPLIKEDVRLTVGATGCRTAAAMFLVDYRFTDPWLPPGYHPRDLSEVLSGYQVAPDKVPILASVVTCEKGLQTGAPVAMGGVVILVESPGMPTVERSADLDFYVVRFHSDHPEQVHHWRQFDLDAQRMDMQVRIDAPLELTFDDVGQPFQADLSGRDGERLHFRFAMSGGAAQELEEDLLVRYWHQGPNGTYFESGTLPSNGVFTAAMTDCEVADASLVYEILGAVRCPEHRPTGPVQTPYQQAVVVQRFDQVLDARYLPGVFAA